MPGIQLAHAGRKASTSAPVARPRVRAADRRRLADRSRRPPSPFAGCATPRRALDADEHRRRWSQAFGARPRAGPSPPASTWSRSTPRTATCCTSSCRRCPTSAPTSTAATSRAAPAARRGRRRGPRAWPGREPLFVRLSATDWVDGGWTVDEVADGRRGPGDARRRPGRRLQRRQRRRPADPARPGLPGAVRPRGPGAPGCPSAPSASSPSPQQAEKILVDGSADASCWPARCCGSRHWPQRAAHELGADLGLAAAVPGRTPAGPEPVMLGSDAPAAPYLIGCACRRFRCRPTSC